MVKFIAKVVSSLWLFAGKDKRRSMRYRVESWLWGRSVRRTAKSVGKHLIMHGPAVVTPTTTIGDYVGFDHVRIHGGGDVTIGSHTFISENTLIYSQNHDYDTGELIPFGFKYTLRPVKIDDCVWIGTNVIILPGTHIGEGAIIQAGAVVHGEIPPMAIAGGNPAKVFAWRDREHYEELKAKGRFAIA